MAETHNKYKGTALVFSDANASITIVGNNSVSNVAISDENVSGGYINQIIYGAAPSGYWMVKRGSNTVAVLTDSGSINYSSLGAALIKDTTATLDLELVGTANGYIIVEIVKTSV